MARWQYAWMSTHPHRQHSTGLHPGVNANISFVAFYSTVMTVLIDMLAGWLIALLLPIYAEEVASLGRAGARVFHTGSVWLYTLSSCDDVCLCRDSMMRLSSCRCTDKDCVTTLYGLCRCSPFLYSLADGGTSWSQA